MKPERDLYEAAPADERLGEFLLATIRYLPSLLGLLAVGLLAIYGLSRAGLLGKTAGQILAVAGTSLLAAIAFVPIRSLAGRGKGRLAFTWFYAVLALWGFSLVLFWESAVLVAILILWVAPLTALATRSDRRRVIVTALISLACTALLVWLDAHAGMQRLASTNAAGLAGLVLVASTVILFTLGTLIVRLFDYRTLQSRLVVSFALILAVPVLFTTAVSAMNAYSNSLAQFSDSLLAISSLKQSQIESSVQSIVVEMASLQQGSGKAASLLHVLNRSQETDESYRLNSSIAATMLRDLTVQFPSSQYEEVLLLDLDGNVILSTYTLDQGLKLGNEEFVRQGKTKFFAELIRFPGKLNSGGNYKLVAAAPLFGDSAEDVRGVVVTVAKSNVIFGIMGPTVGGTNVRTYLASQDSKVISDAPGSDSLRSPWPLINLTIGQQGQKAGVYTNEREESVLGYGAWDPTINTVIVAEVPHSDVFSKALSTLLVSTLVGIFGIFIAAIVAVATSRAISEPILRLASAAKALSTGDLTSRAAVDQQDEVGTLAVSFNAMADQLQGIIGNLEQRVTERTEALEEQSMRLRTAAEVARDAASAQSLDELLDRAGRLVMDRFGFYHTGIFLIDEKHEYAVLRASPSEAGKRMLQNQHKLRVGEQGIVGRVAATGEPRIALDTGVDSVYFSNPLLPNTHSEMALPLKTAEGTIGVIDIQSDQPEAFTQEDIAIVQVMADQLATAIQRTLLLQQVQAQLNQLEEAQLNFTQRSWKTFAETGRANVGYRFDNVQLEPIKTRNGSSGTRPAPDSRGELQGHILEVPIRLRGQTIGIVNLRFQSALVPDATADMIQQIADRLATALENARLLEESLRRANKERAIGEITSKISASVNMRNVLQTAVEELGRAIPGSDVMIQFRPDAEIQ